MQRSYPLRWLALTVGLIGSTQCLDSISDDCTKTLTCNDAQPTLQANCEWRYPDGSLWVGGPQQDPRTGRWRWPDGKETDTQDLDCDPPDAGADGGIQGPDCRRGVACDVPYVCDETTGACVQCLDDTQCSGNLPVGDAGAATVCDQTLHQCVACLERTHCSGDTPVCKISPTNSIRNECVQCQGDGDCGGANPACDTATNECTSRCTSAAQCGGDKPFCNLTKELCVECLDQGDCQGSETQCKIDGNECVECIDDAPCASSGEVCDTERNLCVECRDDVQCATNPRGTRCDLRSNLCVQCLDDQQCSNDASSRCNLTNNQCVGCNSNAQCENGFLCNTSIGNGTCVQCLVPNDCTGDFATTCETTTGTCVQCLNSTQCLDIDAAHCETRPNIPNSPQFTCVGCQTEADCGGKPLPGLCDAVRGLCVDCLTNAECSELSTLSRCQNGSCALCTLDDDCELFAAPARGNLEACQEDVGCVQCVTDAHCADTPNAPNCKLTDTGESAGDAALNTCVQCVDNDDCPSPGASQCVNNQCVACTATAGATDPSCSHVRAANGTTVLGVCDAGTCVQCTGPRRGACGTNVCDSLAKTCSQTRTVAGAALCEDCISDFECPANARCVQQTAGGAQSYFCYPQPVNALCGTRGFALQTPAIATIDTPSAAVCLQRDTTCPAYLNYIGGQECDDEDDDEECGPEGRCELGAAGFRCTISCVSADDCTGSAACLASGCEI